VWGEAFGKCAQHLVQGSVVSITGRLDKREEPPRIVANEVKPVKKPQPKEKPLVLHFRCGHSTEADLMAVRDILWKNPGARPVQLRFESADRQRAVMMSGAEFQLAWSPQTEALLKAWM